MHIVYINVIMSLVYFSMHVVVTGGFPQEKEAVAIDLEGQPHEALRVLKFFL
jgi:amino acid transporter